MYYFRNFTRLNFVDLHQILGWSEYLFKTTYCVISVDTFQKGNNVSDLLNFYGI